MPLSRPAALLAALGLLVTACAGPGGLTADPAGSAEAGDGLLAVATVFPLAWTAEQVAPAAEVVFLGARGHDPHDLELSPSDRERLESADVVLDVGDVGFQPQVEAAVADRAGELVSVADVAGAERLLDHDGHHDDHAHDDDRADDDDDRAHGAVDPHLWFDTGVMADVAERTGEAFATVDPDHADDYRDNARVQVAELEALGDDIDRMLSDCELDTVIVSHEAYAYLLEPRGLRQEGISGAGGHAEASPRRLAELAERIRREGIPAIAAEPVEGRADAEALAAEVGVELVEIDPLEIVDDDAYATGYIQLLREQARSFATALDCDR